MDAVYVVYCYTNTINGKRYVGQTKNLKNRETKHQSPNGCRLFYKAIKKYGYESFNISILKEGLTIDSANIWESYYIAELKSLSPEGYNLRTGGNNSLPSEETRLLLSRAQTGKIYSEERCAKMSEAKKKNMTPEIRACLSRRGTIMSDEQKAKLVASNTGKKRTAESCEKMSNAQKNRTRSKEEIDRFKTINIGRKLTDEQRQNISDRLRERPPISEATREKLRIAAQNRDASKYAMAWETKKQNPEKVLAASKKRWETRKADKEKLAKSIKKMLESRKLNPISPEKQAEAHQKMWETRRAKKLANMNNQSDLFEVA